MSEYEGRAQYGEFWAAYTGSMRGHIHLEADERIQIYTPTQARDLARALLELADEIDGVRAELVKGGAA